MNETAGVLRPAIEAYLNHAEMTPEHIAAMRAYIRQWIGADGWHDCEELRQRVDDLTTRTAIREWLDDAEDKGIDPL